MLLDCSINCLRILIDFPTIVYIQGLLDWRLQDSVGFRPIPADSVGFHKIPQDYRIPCFPPCKNARKDSLHHGLTVNMLITYYIKELKLVFNIYSHGLASEKSSMHEDMIFFILGKRNYYIRERKFIHLLSLPNYPVFTQVSVRYKRNDKFI